MIDVEQAMVEITDAVLNKSTDEPVAIMRKNLISVYQQGKGEGRREAARDRMAEMRIDQLKKEKTDAA